MWDFQGLIKNEVEFLGVTKKKLWNFQGSSILGFEFPRDVTQLCGAFLSGISRGKAKKQKIPGGFSKKYVLNLHFFLE